MTAGGEGAEDQAGAIPYRRSRFSTRLPAGRLYTASHFWLAAQPGGEWRVGFTRFATRMLGEVVEYGFEVRAGDPVGIGQTIGWIEGFKARSDLYGLVAGEFAGANPRLAEDITLVDTDPYGEGWLYKAKGEAEPNSVDVRGYIVILDAVIDRMRTKQIEKEGEDV